MRAKSKRRESTKGLVRGIETFIEVIIFGYGIDHHISDYSIT